MVLSNIVENWDGILYSLYNFCTITKSFFCSKEDGNILKKNSDLKDKYKGERCFVVMNGPSLNEHDLTPLKGEYVFCSNYFYKSDLAEIIQPNFYSFTDGGMYSPETINSTLDEIRNKCHDVRFILTFKGKKIITNMDDVYLVRAKHLPHKFAIRKDLDFICSNFQTVAFFVINTAIYLGFKEIYVLGLDFNPGGFVHFANLGVECSKPEEHFRKEDVAGDHWGYAKAHYESYALAAFAKRNNCRVINLNPQSCIRAFEFDYYERVISKNNGI